MRLWYSFLLSLKYLFSLFLLDPGAFSQILWFPSLSSLHSIPSFPNSLFITFNAMYLHLPFINSWTAVSSFSLSLPHLSVYLWSFPFQIYFWKSASISIHPCTQLAILWIILPPFPFHVTNQTHSLFYMLFRFLRICRVSCSVLSRYGSSAEFICIHEVTQWCWSHL